MIVLGVSGGTFSTLVGTVVGWLADNLLYGLVIGVVVGIVVLVAFAIKAIRIAAASLGKLRP